jgi:hypothetical protein
MVSFVYRDIKTTETCNLGAPQLLAAIFRISTSHDMNGQNTVLMTGQKIIDEITDDRIGLVSQFRYDPANQSAAAAVPFQVDCAVCSLTMDFGPTVRATGPLVFSRNQIKPPELRIGHDFFPQRPTPGRDDLDHCLHSTSFSRKPSLLQCLFVVAASLCRGAMAPSVLSTKRR